MSRPTRILSVLLGACWAQGLLVAGIALLLAPQANEAWLLLGLSLVGGGAFVAMGVVIDRLVPDAGALVVLPLKLVASAIFIGCGSLTVYGVLTGQPVSLPVVL
ncbi:MAG: hypothetical protein ACE37H_01940 [Phycisphaeraceae bacterium]